MIARHRYLKVRRAAAYALFIIGSSSTAGANLLLAANALPIFIHGFRTSDTRLAVQISRLFNTIAASDRIDDLDADDLPLSELVDLLWWAHKPLTPPFSRNIFDSHSDCDARSAAARLLQIAVQNSDIASSVISEENMLGRLIDLLESCDDKVIIPVCKLLKSVCWENKDVRSYVVGCGACPMLCNFLW